MLDANPTQYPVTVVRFSPDGRLLAAGGIHGRASLWRVDGWELAWKATVGHNGYDLALAFSPDGEVLASSGTDSKTFLYQVHSGALIGSAFGPAANILTYSAYLPGRAEILALGDEGSLRRWDLDPASWVQRACAIAGRDLTQDEWRELLPERDFQSTCPG